MSYQTPHYSVSDLLDWAVSGQLQLSDFQRSYKWDDERIRSLLVTISEGIRWVSSSGGVRQAAVK